MSDAQVSRSPEHEIVAASPHLLDSGASREAALGIGERQVLVKAEPADDSNTPVRPYHDLGHDLTCPVTIDDDGDDDDGDAPREMALGIGERQVLVKAEPADDSDTSVRRYHDFGYDSTCPITIDDDGNNEDDDAVAEDNQSDQEVHRQLDDNGGKSRESQTQTSPTEQIERQDPDPEVLFSSPNAAPESLALTTEPDALTPPVVAGEGPHLGNSILSSRSHKHERRDPHQMRLLRRRLRTGISSDDYGPIRDASASATAPSDNAFVATRDDLTAQAHVKPASAPSPFEQARLEYESNKANGTSTLEDDIQFLRLVREEAVRTNQEAEDARIGEDTMVTSVDEDYIPPPSDSEDGLFVTDTSGPCLRRERNSTWARDSGLEDKDGFEEGNVLELQDLGQHARDGAKKRKRYNEGYSREEDDGQKGKKERRKKKGRSARADSLQEDASNNGAAALGSLMQSDIFRDQAANQNAPALPDITDTRKLDVLKNLIASVPTADRKRAITDRKELLKASKKFSQRAARPDGRGGWKITGMTTSLQNHQLIGSGFMRDRERGGPDDKPHGGICADSMGLGKTLEMIATVINERPRKPAPGEPRATLIVLPATLVTQWKDELDKHVDPRQRLQTVVHKAGSRVESNNLPEALGRFDVVLTTYHEVSTSYPKVEIPIEMQTSEEKLDWWRRHYEENRGPLHRVEWRRVVLDEAQAIKNYRSRTSLACRALVAKYRWALSGTPILNSPLELYPFFKFLDVPYTGSLRVFKANYYSHDEQEEPLERLKIMLSRFMIRRTHKDKLFGAPIVKLPKASDRVSWVKFNDLERAIYEIVHRRMVTRINGFSRDNTLQRNYRSVLTMLLRLRQMTGNVLMVEIVMKDLLEREDHEKIRKLAEKEVEGDSTRRAQLIELRKMLARPLAPENKEEDGVDGDDNNANNAPGLLDHVPDERISIGAEHGRKFSFGKYLQDLRKGEGWEEVKKRTLCVVCRNVPELPYVTACYHIYCSECLEGMQHQSAARGEARSRCVECQCEYAWACPCDDFELESIMSDIEEGDGAPPVDRWRLKTKKKAKGRRERPVDENRVAKSWIQRNGAVLPSAKTIAVKAQIINWLEQDPDAKILVYTQFMPMIHILRKVCQTEGWRCRELTGQMPIAARDKALEAFKSDNTSILLASLRCGGLGLNLTAAKHVISIDPWWNRALEQQAFCRVFRIGQTEETTMTRFVVQGTIDEKLIKMQDTKQEQIDRVMGDRGTCKNLSVHQMMRLFGPVKEDGKGRCFIIAENKQTLPQFNADSEYEGDEM